MEDTSSRPEDIILRRCLRLGHDESCLIITDDTRKGLAEKIFTSARGITGKTKMAVMPELKNNGSEPPVDVARKMLGFDVILILTSRSMSHTKARQHATDKGARLASMPGITEDILKRAIDVDYDKMSYRTNILADMLDRADEARITTDKGTDIRFSLNRRKAHGRRSGIYDAPSSWGNLPEGEAFIAPVEGTARGRYVVDASQAEVGKLDKPITIDVKDGYAYGFSGERSKGFKRFLESFDDPAAFNIAEFGIGTNDKAKVTGNVLEDEKVLGTCHIALGNNFGFGGRIDVPVHVDGIINRPNIFLDGKAVMKQGALLYQDS